MNRMLIAATIVFIAACSKTPRDAARDSAGGAVSDSAPKAAAVDTTRPVSATTPATSPAAGALLDPNAATKEQLTAIPNITPAPADAHIPKRPYENMLGVNKVLAALPKPKRDTVYMQLFKPIDLNSATPEEITSIPGVGAKMRHEFQEYRPYKNIEQFRREIGKY